MRRRMLTTIDAPPEAVRAAAEQELGVAPAGDALVGRLRGTTSDVAELRVEVVPSPDGTSRVSLEAASDIRIPYFGWLVGLLARLEARRELGYAVARLRAAVSGGEPPAAPKQLAVLPPAAFNGAQAAQLAAVAALAALVNFSGGLLTQNGDAATEAFHESDRALGTALAIARAGVLVSLVAAALADRIGRRRLLLACLIGSCATNAVTAVAPSFGVFTGAQLLTRALVNAALVVAAVAAVEDAPEGARAWAFSMFGLALGLGFSLTVVLLPLADLGTYGWRISFAISAAAIVFVPSLGRRLQETERYERLTTRPRRRGRVREVFDVRYGARFLWLGLAAFLANVFSAPSSQLTNRYLTRTHDFSNAQVALFRSVTLGLPGIIGILLAGRLAERRGRLPVGIAGLVVGSIFQMLFFVGDGLVLWVAPTIAIVAAAMAALSLGTLDSELFPTEVRGTSNGFLLVAGVAGSAAGLLLATNLKGPAGGLGPAIALCGIAPLVAAGFVMPRLPETAARPLDDVSPSEV